MKKILLVTDFSVHARNTFAYSIEMFGHVGVEYLLLNTYPQSDSGSEMLIQINDLLEHESTKKLRDEWDFLTQKYRSNTLSIKMRSETGFLTDIVNQVCKNEGIDLVVLGATNGHSDSDAVTWDELLLALEWPTLVVPLQYKLGG